MKENLLSDSSSPSSKKTNQAFTLVEILIAAGVLSIFMTGVFAIYRSGSKGFVAGSWRAEEQKKAQLFLSALSRDLSMANSGLVRIEADGTKNSVQATPVYVNKGAFRFNTAPAFFNTNVNNWTCLLAFSVSYPYLAANATFSTPVEPGRWSGISVWAKNRKVRYIRTGDPVFYSSTPVGLPGAIVQFPGPGLVKKGGDFEPDNSQNRNHEFDFSLDEIAIVASGTSLASPNGMEIICKFVRYENGKKTESEIIQNVAVKLASMTPVVTF
ncbi:MAG: hypothetical protein Kow0029_21370 [Candidatus Rifleibacteriota bacterium]